MQLHIRTQCAHYRGIAYILHIYTHTHAIQYTDLPDKLATHTHSLIHCLCLSGLDGVIHPVHVWRLSGSISSVVQIHRQILTLVHLSCR